MRYRGRVAVVTGGASGIGRAIAQRLAEEGLTVVIADRRFGDAAAASKAIGAGSFAIELDVTSPASMVALVEQTVQKAGRIDVLVNSAGQFDMLPFLDVTPESYERVFSVNVAGVLFMMQTVAKQMIAQGSGGKMINLASQAGRRGEPLVSVYCASKAAVISLTQSAGLALISHGINVNAIAPGVIDTPMYDYVDSLCAKYMNIPIGENKRQVSNGVPLGRMGKPEEIASMAAFLASNDADYIVAQTYGVDGGNWMA